ncbi:hypothetical protein MJO29_012515 [Puccinia striiformis f. sp. tritici]|nr:hypothetical protein MJO29_012515 [Puccinia striiformis f. sp. tritici]
MISSFSPKQSLPAGPAAMKNPTPISTLSTAPPVTQEGEFEEIPNEEGSQVWYNFQSSLSYRMPIWRSDKRIIDIYEFQYVKTAIKTPHYNLGAELMNLVMDIIRWSRNDVRSNTTFDDNVNAFSPTLEALLCFSKVNTAGFDFCVANSPQLLQVDAEDPFWKADVIYLRQIAGAHAASSQGKAAGWTFLSTMMIRQDSYGGYTPDTPAKENFQNHS